MGNIFYKKLKVGSGTLKVVNRISFRELLTIYHCRQIRTNNFDMVLKCQLAKEEIERVVEFFSDEEKKKGCLKEIRFERLPDAKYFKARISLSLVALENYNHASELIQLLGQRGGLSQQDDLALFQFLGSCEANHVRRRVTGWRSIDC